MGAYHNQASWLPFIAPMITSIITIAGWYVLGEQAETRENRKRVLDLISEARSDCSDVLDNCTAYWITESGFERNKSAVLLKASIDRLSYHILIMRRAGFSLLVQDQMNDLKSNATGGQFENPRRRRKRSQDQERVFASLQSLDEIMNQIHEEYHSMFPADSGRFTALKKMTRKSATIILVSGLCIILR